MRLTRVSILPSLLGALALLAGSARGAGPDFNRDVRPILSANCLKCHGPDEDAREAGLRLDVRDSAVGELDSGMTAVVPGQPDASELVRRIFSNDPDEVMPPPSSNKVLDEGQKKILRAWVAAGAEYQTHWAFVPPRQAPLPEVRTADWPRNAVDYFILHRLESEGLSPNPPADRHVLVRRVYLDLIGLPPTVEEADAFVADDSPDAYERLVDRLLASPYYGERWARRWLDLARYADTNGYEKDRPRSIWPYRDWVINAINADLPFDRFTVEQLAGDMLPNATPSQQIATGFHRNTLLNEEGGIDPLEFRFYAMVDRVGTTATTWLGLTMGCAQCHTHKFDPIPQRDFYRVMAFLNNADEPMFEISDPEVARRRAEIDERITALQARLPERFPAAGNGAETAAASFETAYQTWLTQQSQRAVPWTRLRPDEARSNLPRLTVLEDGSVFASGDQTKSDRYELRFTNLPSEITAIRLEALPDDRLPNHGPGRVFYEGPFGDFFLSEVQLSVDGRAVPLAEAAQSFASGKDGASAAIDGNPQTGWSINGGQGKTHAAIFTLQEPLRNAAALDVSLLFEKYYSAGLGKFRISVTSAQRGDRSTVLPAGIEEALLAAPEKRTADQQTALKSYFLQVVPELAEARKEISELEQSRPAFPTTLVLQERPASNPRPTRLHRRGEFLQPGDPVPPELPSLFAESASVPANRLEFARWLVSKENPLVGRVVMNRQWGAFFGRGLVRTPEDFGYQGERPSHPELLDWLAVELIERGWSIKAMHRLIVTSATYRQSSAVEPQTFARDPENRLLARFPRVRLEAEILRDAALRTSGLLASRLGGPSVFPPQPPGVTSEGTYGALVWKVSEGADRYRRGLYTFTKRSAPYAMFATFDGPSGEVCVARREVSNTPLQALTLLNDEVFVEAARGVARRALENAQPTDSDRALQVFRRCLIRPPSAVELARATEFVSVERERFRSMQTGESPPAESTEASDAKDERGSNSRSSLSRLVPATDGPPPEGIDRAELAAWTLLARALLNLDEAITKE